MSRALLARKSDTEASSSTRASSLASGLKISQPGDAMEREADRVADAVASGSKIPGWSFANVAPTQMQRQPTPPPPTGQPAPQPNNYKEGAEKLGEAFLKTDVGKKLTDAASQDPLVKGASDFVGTLPGKIIVGAAATATVAGLAAEHKALPVQIPEIPLDKVAKGLKVKITYEGPVDRPTKGMITFSYTPGGDQKKKGASESDRIRSDTARLRAEQDEIRAHTTYAPGSQQDLEQKSMDRAVQDVTSRRFGALPGTPGGAPLVPAPGLLQQQQPETGLRLPQYQSPFAPKTPHLLDKQLELKPLTSEPAAADANKKEEKPVQRKAATHSESLTSPASVEATLRLSGLPLDSETRSTMESRFGVDFSQVRVHTDGSAAASARGVDALAYTVGSDVVFGAGQYAPHTREGRRLLAHELTHVVQQSAPPALQASSRRGASVRAAKGKVQPAERSNGAEIVVPPIARRASRRVQRKVKMLHDPNPTYSGFARLQELLDRLNKISQTLTFSMQGNELSYTQRSSAKMSNFDTQMKGFIDQDPVIPMKLTNKHGRLGDAEHGFHTQITIDNYASGYVDIDDLLASDDLGLQEALVHVLAERTATTNYAGRLGSPSLDQSTPLKRDQFLAAHEAGIDAEVELMKDFFGDDTIQADPGPNPGDDFHNFINSNNDHIYARLQQGAGDQSGVQSVHIEVVTADGRTLTPEQFRALVKSRKAAGSGGATQVHPKAAGSAPATADAGSVGEGLRSPSHPLDRSTQSDMETRFRFDFSQVRVHSGGRAAASARSVNALAYTVGSDVVFGAGQYAPHTDGGRRLLAHELTHVVQQSRGWMNQPEQTLEEQAGRAEQNAQALGRAGSQGSAFTPRLLMQSAGARCTGIQLTLPHTIVLYGTEGSMSASVTLRVNLAPGSYKVTYDAQSGELVIPDVPGGRFLQVSGTVQGTKQQIAAAQKKWQSYLESLTSTPVTMTVQGEGAASGGTAGRGEGAEGAGQAAKGPGDSQQATGEAAGEDGGQPGGSGAGGTKDPAQQAGGGTSGTSAVPAQGSGSVVVQITDPAQIDELKRRGLLDGPTADDIRHKADQHQPLSFDELIALFDALSQTMVVHAAGDQKSSADQDTRKKDSWIDIAQFIKENRDKFSGQQATGDDGMSLDEMKEILAKYHQFVGVKDASKPGEPRTAEERVEKFDPEKRASWNTLQPWEKDIWKQYTAKYGEPSMETSQTDLHLTPEMKFRIALHISPNFMKEGAREAAHALFNDPIFIGGTLLSIALYIAAWLAPEPLFSKAFAAGVTIALLSVFSLSEIRNVAVAWMRLEDESEAARSFDELEAAGENFGKSIGGVGLRVLVMLATIFASKALPTPEVPPEGGGGLSPATAGGPPIEGAGGATVSGASGGGAVAANGIKVLGDGTVVIIGPGAGNLAQSSTASGGGGGARTGGGSGRGSGPAGGGAGRSTSRPKSSETAQPPAAAVPPKGEEVFQEITDELSLERPRPKQAENARQGAADARKAGFVGKTGQPQKVDLAVHPHGSAPTVRDELGVSGSEAQSAHVGPTSGLRDVPGYSRSGAETTLLDPKTHAAFDSYWKDWAQGLRRAGRTTCTAGELFDVMLEAIERIPGLSPQTKGALSWRLQQEMFIELGLKPDTVVKLPYPNIKPQ